MNTYKVTDRTKQTDDYQKYFFKLIALEFDLDNEKQAKKYYKLIYK